MSKHAKVLTTLVGVAAIVAFGFTAAAAQYGGEEEAEEAVTVTGCLQAAEEAGEFILKDPTGSEKLADHDKLALIPAEGVDMAAHVGHEVEVTVEKPSKKEKGEHEEHEGEHEEGEKEKKEKHLKVTNLTHISASC